MITSDSAHAHGEKKVAARVLVVDDERLLLRAFQRVLTRAGYAVTTTASPRRALELIRSEPFDVIVSDVRMPDMDGVELLRHIRAHDEELPVVFVTGEPTMETAIQALEHGAVRYLRKPVDPDTLTDAVGRAVTLHRMAEEKQQAIAAIQRETELEAKRRRELRASYDAAVDKLWLAFQPIVDWQSRSVYGYEVLLRTDFEPLRAPPVFIGTAEQLGRMNELSRIIRDRAAEQYAEHAPGCKLFVNLHPEDLLDDALFDGTSPLHQIAEHVVLEITERASLETIPDARERAAELRRAGFAIAVDDLGAGYAGLSAIALLEPQVVKLDMTLVRDLPSAPTKRSLVRAMARLASELGTKVVAEGIETADERDSAVELGCDLLQGYFFAKPGRAFPTVDLSSG